MAPHTDDQPHLTISPLPILMAGLGLLLAFFITAQNLDRDNLTLEEGVTRWIVGGSSLGDTLRRVDNEAHPPLYFVLLDGWSALAGESLLAARLLSVLAMLIALAGTYAAGKHLLDRETGLMALLYLTTAGFVVYYAREARMYTLLMAFSALSTWGYQRWAARTSRANTVLYGVLLVALIYTHYQGAWVIVAHGLHALITRRWRWLRVLVLVTLLYLPWFPVLIEQLQERPAWSFSVRPSSRVEIRQLFDRLTDGSWLLLVMPMVLAMVWPHHRQDVHNRREKVLLLLLWISLPPVIILGINAWIRPSYQPRYLVTILPAIALGTAWALRRIRWRGVAYGLLLGLMIAHAVTFSDLWPNPAPWQ